MDILGTIHVLLAVLAMLLGATVFVITKGTSLHIQLGRAYVVCMLGLNGTALFIYKLFGGFGPFHAFVFISLMTVLYGYWAVWSRRPAEAWLRNHYRAMAWSYVGLLAAAAAEAIVRVPAVREWITGWTSFGVAVFLAALVVCGAGGYLIARNEARLLARFGHWDPPPADVADV